jgi:hypothetical protein
VNVKAAFRFLAVGVIVFFVTPAIAIGITGWWLLHDLSPLARDAAQYRAAIECDPGLPLVPCYRLEAGQLLSLSRIPEKCGSRTDRLVIKLESGTYQTDISFDCLAPIVEYADASGHVTAKLYAGRITAVTALGGTVFETNDSPAVGTSLARGLFLVTAAFCGPWLLLNLIVLVRHPRTLLGLWRMLRWGHLAERPSIAA